MRINTKHPTPPALLYLEAEQLAKRIEKALSDPTAKRETFFMDVEIVGCDTVRECDGLAMSSRNKLLTPRARRLASAFNCELRSPRDDEAVRDRLRHIGFEVDYVETRGDRRFGAIVVDCDDKTVRLIDNVAVA